MFYHIAGIDGSVSPGEKEAMQKCISKTCKPMEGGTDRYGTDQAYLINFSFEFEESEPVSENYFKEFQKFYFQNKSAFSTEIINSMLQSSQSTADAYRGKNKK